MSNHIIAGGAGFIGFNLVKFLSESENSKIVILDNLSNPNIDFSLIDSLLNSDISFYKVDLSDYSQLHSLFLKLDSCLELDSFKIWHLAANSDIPSGVHNPEIDYRDTFMTTFNLLKVAKKYSIANFVFASSSAIYGDHGTACITELTSPLMPISNYGAMKLASEAICYSAYEDFLSSLRVYRFPNVVGVPATHGVLFDFVRKLHNTPHNLDVLGDGSQEKSYLHVNDLVYAMVYLSNIEIHRDDNPIFNLGGTDQYVSVRWMAEQVRNTLSPAAQLSFGSEPRGWKGDIPVFRYDTSKAMSYGWQPKLDSKQAVKLAIDEIIAFLGLNNDK